MKLLTTGDALYQDILRDPLDESLRGIYADWLKEHEIEPEAREYEERHLYKAAIRLRSHLGTWSDCSSSLAAWMKNGHRVVKRYPVRHLNIRNHKCVVNRNPKLPASFTQTQFDFGDNVKACQECFRRVDARGLDGMAFKGAIINHGARYIVIDAVPSAAREAVNEGLLNHARVRAGMPRLWEDEHDQG